MAHARAADEPVQAVVRTAVGGLRCTDSLATTDDSCGLSAAALSIVATATHVRDAASFELGTLLLFEVQDEESREIQGVLRDFAVAYHTLVNLASSG